MTRGGRGCERFGEVLDCNYLLLLEPDEHPAAKPFKEALVADGIPLTSFGVDDVDAVHEDLVAKGVTIVQPPTDMGPVRTLILDDTCGNLIQLAAMKE